MKPKYGIISIGCFIAYPLFVRFFMHLGKIYGGGDGSPLFFWALLTYHLCIFLGIIFGVLGIVKKESPKIFYIIGLLLNLGFVFWLLYLIGFD